MNFKQFVENTEDYEMFGDPNEWHNGTIAILDNAGLYDISVCRIVPFDEAPKIVGEPFRQINPNTVYKHNDFGSMTYKKGESVPIKCIEAFGFHAKRSLEDGGYHYVGAQNLHKTIDSLIKKQLTHIYPDIILQYVSSPIYHQLITQFPVLKDKSSPFDQIGEYEHFTIHGQEVIVCPELKAKKYYFAIPSMHNIRSQQLAFDDKGFLRKFKLDGWENGRFNTIQDAANAAEKFINYTLYGEKPT